MIPGGKQLRRWYCGQGLQQRQTAELLGVSPGTVSNLVSGVYRPSVYTALRIQKLTGIDLEAWLSEDEQRGLASVQEKP